MKLGLTFYVIWQAWSCRVPVKDGARSHRLVGRTDIVILRHRRQEQVGIEGAQGKHDSDDM